MCGLLASLIFPYGHDRCSEGEMSSCGYIPAVLHQAQEQSNAALPYAAQSSIRLLSRQ